MKRLLAKFSYLQLGILVFSGLFFAVAGCSYFKVTTSAYPEQDVVSKLLSPGRTFVVHQRNIPFVADQLYVMNDSLIGIYLSEYTPPLKPGKNSYLHSPEPNGSAYRYKNDVIGRGVLKEIHLFADTLSRIKTDGTVRIALSLKDVYRFDVYSKDGSTTTLSWLALFVLSIPVAMFAVFAVVMLIGLITGSCPFIYANTPDGFRFEGEIYSGAVYAPMERDDYLSLPHLIAEDGEYIIKMSNEVKEIQYTNLAELLVIDHPAAVNVLVDKYGNCQTSVRPEAPIRAVSLTGSDVLSKVFSKDTLIYSGDLSSDSVPLLDGMILTFRKPDNAQEAKLFLRIRNTQWLDYVYKSTRDMLGSYYDNWMRKQNKADPQKLEKWPLSQKIPLSVYVEKNGRWEFCDYFNMAGPMALKDDVLALVTEGIPGDSIRIKLEAGCLFWEVDYAALDYTANIPLRITAVKPAKVISDDDENITGLLEYSDLKYYVQQNGDIADLSYKSPPVTDKGRTVILHSRGYYQMLAEGRGRPDFRKLKQIRESGQFLEYSRELLNELLTNPGSALARQAEVN